MMRKITEIRVSTEIHDYGSIWIERLIEKWIIDSMELPTSVKMILLRNYYREMGDSDEDVE